VSKCSQEVAYDQNSPRNNILRFLKCLHLFGTDPKADYAVRLSGEEWRDWGALLAICILSGECKPSAEFTKQTAAQLAMNNVPALIMFILVHLSTRMTADQPLPPWMWTYGFVYTELGLTIYAHFPKLVKTDDGKWTWKFVSCEVTKDFQNMWREGEDEELQMRGLAAINMMRSHTEFVLEQLLIWSKNLPKTAVTIMDTLIARAHFEMKDYDWLLEKAREKRANVA
jgi:hypothetical protein